MFEIYALLVNFVFGLLIWLFLLRLGFQLVRAPFNNGFVQSIYTYLAPILRPFERVIPRYGNFSIPCFVVVMLLSLMWAIALQLGISLGTLFLAAFLLLQSIYWMLLFLLFAYIIMSFVQPNPYNDFVIVIRLMAEPLVRPFRRIIPPLGPLDLSVAVCLLCITVVYKLLTLGLVQLATLSALSAAL